MSWLSTAINVQFKWVDLGDALLSSQANSPDSHPLPQFSKVLLASSVNQAIDMWSVGLIAIELASGVDDL